MYLEKSGIKIEEVMEELKVEKNNYDARLYKLGKRQIQWWKKKNLDFQSMVLRGYLSLRNFSRIIGYHFF